MLFTLKLSSQETKIKKIQKACKKIDKDMKIAFIEHKGHKNKKKHHFKFVRSNTIKSNHECTMVQDELSFTIPAAK